MKLSNLIRLTCIVFFLSTQSHASEPDWSKEAPVSVGGRSNPYQLSEIELPSVIRAGKLHALHYPVTTTGMKVPYEPMRRFLNAQSDNPFKYIIMKVIGAVTDFHNFEEVENWLGLQPYPETEGNGVFAVPWPNGQKPEHRMGFTTLQTSLGPAFSISCAECHVGNLFGQKIIGLNNRFPRANAFFVRSLKGLSYVSEGMFEWQTDANPNEVAMYRELRHAAQYIEAKMPAQLGLDTSLAQVSLSLAKRLGKGSEPHPLRTYVADSKPAVWWLAKYKNRWLSDGSVVAGNPIFTNLIWNEIGRGAELDKLNQWLTENAQIVKELTTAVFSSEPPLITDFFPAERIDEMQARRGEQVFVQNCTRCHGYYDKAWNHAEFADRPWAERLRTLSVDYSQKTRVIDVGTDPNRYLGMKSLTALNDLDISKSNGIRIEPQKGYVPQPLVGIWARWPYMHNNSIPSLCVLLTPEKSRPRGYWAREAIDRNSDFDFDCNGYPMTMPENQALDYYYDSHRPGMKNGGHSEGILVKNGVEKFNAEDRKNLITYLQTL